MKANDPDFLSLVEANRFKPSPKDINNPKAVAREREKKKAYLSENICLRLVPPPSSSPLNQNSKESSTSTVEWNIPRFRLTESFLHETVNRGRDPSSSTLVVSHLHDQRANTVLLPKDLHECRSSPVTYHVHVVSAAAIKKSGVLSGPGDSYYNGDLIFLIQNVPELSKNTIYEVIPDDIHRWLVHGAISGVQAIQIQVSKVETLKQTLQQLDKEMKNMHATPIYNEHGRAIVGSPLKDAREAKFKLLKGEKEQMSIRLEKAQQSLEAARARHFSACSLNVTERGHNGQRKDSKSFSVKVMGKKKEYYTNIICDKNDWSLVPMYATGDRAAKAKSKCNGSKSAVVLTIGEEDKVRHFVDVGTVSVEMMPDGFGVHEVYHEHTPISTENENVRGRHRLFHGYFREGRYHEGTLHTDAGVYSGTFMSNEPCKGTMKYSDGIVFNGDFRRDGGSEISDYFPMANPYRPGLPHAGRVSFKDGAYYEGEFLHGRISSKGIYRYPVEHGGDKPHTKKSKHVPAFRETKGDFVDGMIQNNDGVEGQGGSNLLRSLMFGGERLWG